jgi:hypothetical protein
MRSLLLVESFDLLTLLAFISLERCEVADDCAKRLQSMCKAFVQVHCSPLFIFRMFLCSRFSNSDDLKSLEHPIPLDMSNMMTCLALLLRVDLI